MIEKLTHVCMPYWNRANALRETLRNFKRHYLGDENLVLVVVDDGSGREPARPVMEDPEFDVDETGWIKVVIELPVHDRPRCSAEAMNTALSWRPVDSAGAVTFPEPEVLVLQNPETPHEVPVLHELSKVEGDDYLICACYDPSLRAWYEHSQRRKVGMHWCVGARRELWEKALPIDVELMKGVCYEDNDLRNRVHRAGGNLVWRDDLLVHHRKDRQEKVEGKSMGEDRWDPELGAVNRARYRKVWGSYWPATGLSTGE